MHTNTSAGALRRRFPTTSVGGTNQHPAASLLVPPPNMPFLFAEAAARRAALSLPVIIVQPDESAVFGAKLYRTPSGDMRWVQLR